MATYAGEPSSELQTRIHKYLLYDNISEAFLLIALLMLVGVIFLSAYITYIFNLTTQISNLIFSLGIIIFGICLFSLQAVLNRKRKEYYVESDEWAKFYVYFIGLNLVNSINSQAVGMKKSYRKKALKNAKDFLSCVDERWTVGKFSLSKNFVGDSISDFKKNLQYRVIPAIKDGDDELLGRVNSAFSTNRLAPSPLWPSFSIEVIEEANKQLSTLPNREPLKIGTLAKAWRFLTIHKMMRHSVILALIAFLSSVLGYIFWTHGVSTDNAWLGSIAIFGILTGVYFSIQHRPEA
jgi:hypothetical protein